MDGKSYPSDSVMDIHGFRLMIFKEHIEHTTKIFRQIHQPDFAGESG